MLVRVGGTLLALYVGWSLLNAYALPAFLVCTAVAGWRLLRASANLSVTGTGRGPRSDTNRPPPPETGQPGKADPPSPAPSVAPVARPSRSLDRALAELNGMVGLGGVKAEIRKLIDVLAAERERARLATPAPARPRSPG